MSQVPAQQILRIIRGVHTRVLAARRAAANLDPKAIERSTIAGISLFAASSIALQGFVVAQGSFSGRASGVAQAAIVPMVALRATDGKEAPSAEADDLQPLARGDRLAMGESRADDDRRLPRVASLVTADIEIAKSASPTGLNLRVDTFGPDSHRSQPTETASLRERASTGEVNMGPRVAGVDIPKPTRVAYLSAPASDPTREVRKDCGVIIHVDPPARSSRTSHPHTSHNGRVPQAVIEKVHFQDNTPDRCLPNDLMDVIYDVAEKFGEVQVLSTFRDPIRNRRVGGAPRSFHLRCQAIDFRVVGKSAGLYDYLEKRAEVGGLKRYPLGFFHIDTGPRRSW